MMKRIFLLLITLLAVTQAHAEVGVSVSVGQPGFYGQIDIGDFTPQPQVIYMQPRLIQPVVMGHVRPVPIYLRVPPGHSKRWPRFCARYNACGVPVYFVSDTWYNEVYVPKYKEHYEHEGRDHGKGHHDDRYDYRGPQGKNHGHDHDNDRDHGRH
jgi:hypothetical protein